MKLYTLLFSLFLSVSVIAQTTSGLAAYYSMDDCTLLDNSDAGSNGTLFGSTCDSCGVINKGIFFRGEDPANNNHDYALLLGTVNNNFKTNDFSISFYMKPKNSMGTKDIISKREDCSANNAFAIRFIPATNSIDVVLSENSSKNANLSAPLDFGRCWQHVLFIREGKNSKLYINGVLKKDKGHPDGPINIDNNAVFSLINSPCQATLEVPFIGIIDELYIYKKALNENEIAMLYNNPHKIITENKTIFLGETVDLEATESCNVSYEWTPPNFLSATDVTSVSSTPDSSILYTLAYTEDQVCISYDTVRITVIDPSTLPCDKIYLPKAFTPNNDNINDTYGISNPFAIEELLSFEIYDRWGSRVFFTDNETTKWDGSFQGEPMNPGVLLYRVRFKCNGEERIDVGSLAIMR
ncbi:MAG: gliding motility-associated-like protein [Polaribacter sp.]|jgi:gliding motility-associated-like protein